MSPIQNRNAIFNEVPQGFPVLDKTVVVKTESIDLDTVQLNGGVLAKTLYLSIDPYLRGLMQDCSPSSYSTAFEIGKPVWGFGLASAVRSDKAGVRAGDILYVPKLAFQEYNIIPADGQLRVINDEGSIPLSSYLSVLGMPGMTAFYGLELVGKPKKGETIYVSSGASSVGSVVAQLAKAKGLKVIASAGSEEKVAFLKSIGVDVAFNYKTDSVNEVLAKEGPIDICWDNVGGSTLEAAIDASGIRGRIIICGAISSYNTDTPYGVKNTPSILYKRLLIQGFAVFDGEVEYEDEENNPVKFLNALSPLVKSGELKQIEQVFEGIESVGEAIIAVQTGASTAKVVVKL